jgi:hypothetical protein
MRQKRSRRQSGRSCNSDRSMVGEARIRASPTAVSASVHRDRDSLVTAPAGSAFPARDLRHANPLRAGQFWPTQRQLSESARRRCRQNDQSGLSRPACAGHTLPIPNRAPHHARRPRSRLPDGQRPFLATGPSPARHGQRAACNERKNGASWRVESANTDACSAIRPVVPATSIAARLHRDPLSLDAVRRVIDATAGDSEELPQPPERTKIRQRPGTLS